MTLPTSDWISGLHTNQRLVAEALVRRGATVEPLDLSQELLRVSWNGRSDLLLDRFSAVVAITAANASADKHLAKRLLSEAGLRVPEGRLVRPDDPRDLRAAAEALLPGDLVLKPNWGSHGDEVRIGLQTLEAVEDAADALLVRRGGGAAVLERMVPGREHRIFATTAGGFAVLERKPAFVVGDGRRSLGALAAAETERRLRLKAEGPTALCPIVLDGDVRRFLSDRGLTLDDVPKAGEEVRLRAASNLAKGGVPIDRTGEAHPGWRSLALRALAVFPGLPMAGLDVMTPDIALDPERAPYAVLEVNSSPGLAMHAYPAEGRPRPVADQVVDVMFPFIPAS